MLLVLKIASLKPDSYYLVIKISFGRKVVNLHHPFLQNRKVLLYEKKLPKSKQMQYFLQRCCLTTLVLFPTDLPSRCLPLSTGHSSSFVFLVSLMLAYAFTGILWWLFSAAAPNLASMQIPLAHHPDQQLKRLLRFSV